MSSSPRTSDALVISDSNPKHELQWKSGCGILCFIELEKKSSKMHWSRGFCDLPGAFLSDTFICDAI